MSGVSSDRALIAEPGARERHPSMPIMPAASVHQLIRLQRVVRRSLGDVRVPLLVAHGALDNTANPADLETLPGSVGIARRERLVLRLEDLDPQRCRPEYATAMQQDLAWLGLEWDAVVLQSQSSAAHDDAIAMLSGQGLVSPCRRPPAPGRRRARGWAWPKRLGTQDP